MSLRQPVLSWLLSLKHGRHPDVVSVPGCLSSSVYSAAGPGSFLSAPAFSHDPTGTSGIPCSVQTTLLVRFPPRWLQPDYILRQLPDSRKTHILATTYIASAGYPAIDLSPCHQGLPQAASNQEGGSFHGTPNATCQAKYGAGMVWKDQFSYLSTKP